jgi:hypothetical protein
MGAPATTRNVRLERGEEGLKKLAPEFNARNGETFVPAVVNAVKRKGLARRPALSAPLKQSGLNLVHRSGS